MGALGQPYISALELKQYLNIDETKASYNLRLEDAVNSASREIDQFCGRQFNRTETASARVYEPLSRGWVGTDDFYTTEDLVIDWTGTGGDGVYTVVTTGEYILMPYNGVVDGSPGWPYNKIRTYANVFPFYGKGRPHGLVRVTAKWGWATVPPAIRQAAFLLGAQTFKLADAPFGVAGFDQAGSVVRVRDLPQVASKLNRFVSTPVLVG